MVSLCSGQFVLRLDDDECLGGEWGRSLPALADLNDLTHFLTPCRWIVPPGDHFIASDPWFSDFHLRLFRNEPDLIVWPDQIHEPMGVRGRGLILLDQWIDHYVLVDRSRPEREAKCRYYQSVRPAKHLSDRYLWEDQQVQLLPADAEGYAAAVERAVPNRTRAEIRSPRPYDPGSEIRFDADGNAGEYKLKGWSVPEPWGTWTDGYRAELSFSLQGNILGTATLTVEAGAYVRPGHPCLRVLVVCGCSVTGEWAIDTPEIVRRTLRFSDSMIARSDNNLRVAFHIVNPASPQELGESDDGRLLGLGFRSVRLTSEEKEKQELEQ